MIYCKKLFCLLLIVTLFSKNIKSNNFNNLWELMQKEYSRLSKIETQSKSFQDKFCHPFWQSARKDISRLIYGAPNKDFLNIPAISGTMVRRGYSNFQKYEVDFLTYGLSEKNKNIFFSKQLDTNFGNLEKISPLNVSANTLGHLFYLGKIFENCDISKINTIVEFGGGYGNMARLFKKVLPRSTIILLDLPETLVIQAFFLRNTLKDASVIVHDHLPGKLEEGAIHLIPVFFVNDLNMTADLFISTFALSEATEFLQEAMLTKRFYEADNCYIVGQVNGWEDSHFVQHTKIIAGIRDIYEAVSCIPFHHGLVERTGSYEIFGKKI